MEILVIILVLIGIGTAAGLAWGLLRAVPILGRVLLFLARGIGRGFAQGWREKRAEQRRRAG